MATHGILYIGIGTVASGPALVDLGKRIELQLSKLFALKDVHLSACYTQIAQGEKQPLVVVYHLEKTALERFPNLNDPEFQITELLETETSPNLAAEMRLYEQIQVYQLDEARDPQIEVIIKGGTPGPYAIFAAIEPAAGTDNDLDNWYRQEHLGLVSEVGGFIRSRRYKLRELFTFDLSIGQQNENIVPRYLAIHEFQNADYVGETLTPPTVWSARILKSVRHVDLSVYKLLNFLGTRDG
ncbi:uncharacterized protein BP5553_05512 [Venustampulla echinocandica]|uniref:EthD domain-containing protein n=1 Tax=Venustampulla echinocandica TaxID=2656787 RepID=A0A370TRC5_9HELO|nr:uncharacterized protein BP5553_05512 [Venustampulla echinocandica]RDL38079.1 hypothetical protein BP5553_05512 [Venustampulla echinocandica]